jgi:hypothetical protein
MALTVVKTTALSGTITNAQLAGSIDLTAKVTGTLPIANGGTNSTSTTFVNAATNMTGTLPIANGGTAITSGFVNGAATTKDAVGSYCFAYLDNGSGSIDGNPGGAGTKAGTGLAVRAGALQALQTSATFSSSYWTLSGTWRNMSSSTIESSGSLTDMPTGLWVRTV